MRTSTRITAFAAGALCVVALFFGLKATGQISNPTSGVTVDQVQALIPVPAAATPQNEQVGGAVGTSMNYMRADAKIPRITRVAIVTTDASGNWSVTWSTPLMSTPAVLPIAINSGAQPVVCNVATTSATGATGSCQMARTLPATLTLLTALVNYSVFQVPATGTQVQILAIPPSQ